MERKSRISIYEILKKTNKTNTFDKNNQPYFEIQEFSHAKAITYSIKETADNMSEIARVYEVDVFEQDLLTLLSGNLCMDEFYQKYIVWDDAIAMLAKPIYEKLKKLVKNNRIDRKDLYYLGVDLTTKSEDVVFAAFGILILSQFQNDISEEMIQTLSKHSRLTYYCLLAVSEFENSIAITNKMISSLNPTSAMIAALSLDYSVPSNVKWLLDYAIPNAREMTALSYKALTDPYIKKSLCAIKVDSEYFSTLTRIAIYGISKENMLSYSSYHTNFISEFLLKMLANLDVYLCETLCDQCFLILAMHIFTSLKDQFSEIEEDILKLEVKHKSEFTKEQMQEIRRNILKEKILVNALLHTDYIENLYNYKFPSDIKDLEEDEIQEFIDQLNEWIDEEYPQEESDEIFQNDRNLDSDEASSEATQANETDSMRFSPYFNEEIENINSFMKSIFKNHNQLPQIRELVMHSGKFEEDYKKLTDAQVDQCLMEIDDMFRSEVFLDNLLDEIQFSDDKPMLSFSILALFNIIPEFPYFQKILENYPLSPDLLNFCTWQFEYYHTDITQYYNSYLKKKKAQMHDDEFIFTDAYVLTKSHQIKKWALVILSKYIEFQDSKQKELEADPEFLCNTLPYAQDIDPKDLLSLFKKSRQKMTSKHFEAVYEFVKYSEHAELRRKFATFLGLTQTLIKNSANYQDAMLKHKQNQHGSIIKLPRTKKS